MRYRYTGEYNPIVIYDIPGGGIRGNGLLVWSGQVIDVENKYISMLNHDFFEETKDKVSTPEDIEALKPKTPKKTTDILAGLDAMEKRIRAAEEANKVLAEENNELKSKLKNSEKPSK